MKRMLYVLLSWVIAIGVLHAQDKPAMEKAGKAKTESKKESKGTETTVNGEVVDVSCYLAHGMKGMGADHKACGEACAKNGSPLGILTKDGKLYVSVLPDDHSTGPNAKLLDHVAQSVKATGIVRSKGGVNGIMITKVESDEGVKKE